MPAAVDNWLCWLRKFLFVYEVTYCVNGYYPFFLYLHFIHLNEQNPDSELSIILYLSMLNCTNNMVHKLVLVVCERACN